MPKATRQLFFAYRQPAKKYFVTLRKGLSKCSWPIRIANFGFGDEMKTPKNMSELCSVLAKMEAGKSQVSIGNIREIMRCLADLMIETDKTPLDIIAKYAASRANSRRKKIK